MELNQQKVQYDQALEYYKDLSIKYNQESFIELLREVQEIYGCIPLHVQEEISLRLNIKASVISSLIRLYPSLTSAPYRHKITLCTGRQCSLKKIQQIKETIKKEINVGVDEITPDGRFQFTVQSCLKKCKTAPNLLVDHDFYSFIKPGQISDILKKYN